MSNKYPNSGVLFYARNRVHPNSPDLNGDLTIDRSLLRQMMEETDEDEIKIRISGWQKEGNYGPFFSLKINTYKKPEEQQQAMQPQKSLPPGDDSDLPF